MSTEELWKEMHMEELLTNLKELFPYDGLSFERLLELLWKGDLLSVVKEVSRVCTDVFSMNAGTLKQLFAGLILMGMISAFYVHFADLIEKYHLSDFGFFSVYLVLTTVLARCFSYFMGMVSTLLENILLFVKTMMPLYLMSVSIATGTLTAAAEGQLFLLLLYTVEKVLMKGFLPIVTFFFLVTVLEGMDGAERWQFLLDLVKKGLEMGVKIALGGVAAIGFLQSLLMPALDGLRGTALQRMITAIPGLGNGAESVLRLACASALVIKNSVGILLIILLFVFCLSPLLKILFLALILKLAAAVMGVISDKRLVGIVERTGQAGLLVFRIAGSAMLFFWFAIAATTMAVKTF